jgi:hypothetical protein
MKVKIAGGSPMERLTNFTKRVIAVDKSELPALEKKWQSRKSKRRKRA